MVNKQKNVFLITLLLVLFFFGLGFSQSLPRQITTQDLIAAIAKHRGKAVLVNFWASWCPACRKELPELISLRKAFSGEELVVIGISLDQNPNALQRFMKKMPFNYPVFRGGGDLVNDFKLVGIPKTLIFDRQGQMVFSRFGYQSEKVLKKQLLSMIQSQ